MGRWLKSDLAAAILVIVTVFILRGFLVPTSCDRAWIPAEFCEGIQ